MGCCGSKLGCLDVFGQTRPGSVRESGRRAGGGANRKIWLNNPKSLFVQKTHQKTTKNIFAFPYPQTSPETPRTWILCLCLAEMPRKHPQTKLEFSCFCPDTPQNIFALSRSKKAPEASQKWNFHVLAHKNSRATKKKTLMLSLQKTSRTPKRVILMFSLPLRPQKEHQTQQKIDFMFSPKRKHHVPPKWICLFFAHIMHQKHPQIRIFWCVFAPKVIEHANRLCFCLTAAQNAGKLSNVCTPRPES